VNCWPEQILKHKISTDKGFTKLIDINDEAHRQLEALEKYLYAHSIAFRKKRFFSAGFVRYSVQRSDLPSGWVADIERNVLVFSIVHGDLPGDRIREGPRILSRPADSQVP
jgi:hypothetical protein